MENRDIRDYQEDHGQDEDLYKIDITVLLDDMWRGFRRFWFIFAAIVLLCTGVFYLRARFSYVPYYEAYSTFVVEAGSAHKTAVYSQTTATQLGETFPYILTSGALREIVENDLGTPVPESITAEVIKGTSLFTIRVRSYTSGERAYQVLQAVIDNYASVAEFIIGTTKLTLMDDSGIIMMPANALSSRATVKKGGLIGIAVSLVLLLGYAVTRKTVRREEDLREYISLPYLGSIPKIKKKKRTKDKTGLLIDKGNNEKLMGESVRSIRSRILHEAESKGYQCILITSTAPGEGKTTFAVNLAISMAKKGKKVILLDGDLRNPSVGRMMGLPRADIGTGDILNGEELYEEDFRQYKKYSLRILSADSRSGRDAGKLLKEKNVIKLIENLKRDSDIVIIDTPPCGMLSDAAVFARCADAAVMVVRQDYLSRDQVVNTMYTLMDTGVDILGYCINGSEVGITGYGYGYGSGYGYGYGYGYGRYGYGRYGYGKSYGYGKVYGEYHGDEEEPVRPKKRNRENASEVESFRHN